MYASTNRCMKACRHMSICKHACIYVCMSVCTCVFVRMYIPVCACLHIFCLNVYIYSSVTMGPQGPQLRGGPGKRGPIFKPEKMNYFN